MPEEAFGQAMRRILGAAGPVRTVVLALSGGMDSVVVATLAVRLRDAAGLGDAHLIAAHMDHCLRGDESDGDREFCRAVARNLGLEFREERRDAKRYAEEQGTGLEQAGRALRYDFLWEVAGQDGLVITGHHADDQAETILMNTRRGAHRRGLAGMREFTRLPVREGGRLAVGRPLLSVCREKILDYALREHLEWREDSSNTDTTFSRNFIRHQVLPLLDGLLPGFKERVLKSAQEMSREESLFSEAGRKLAAAHTRHEAGGRALILTDSLTAEVEPYHYALRHVIEEELGGRLPYGAILSRIAELGERGHLGATLCLPGDIRVRRESDGLFFFHPDQPGCALEEEIILPDPPFLTRAHGFTISAEQRDFLGVIPEEDRDNPYVQWCREDRIKWPLALRVPRSGERFRAIGAPGSRKIHDILMDLKVPRRLRTLPRLLADHAGGIWLWPLRLANRVRLPDEPCNAIRLEMRNVDSALDSRTDDGMDDTDR